MYIYKKFSGGKERASGCGLETSIHTFFKAGIVRSCAHLRAASALELDNTGKEHACSNVRAAIRFLPTTAQLNLESLSDQWVSAIQSKGKFG